MFGYKVIHLSLISECPKYRINMKISITQKINYNLNVSEIKGITEQWVRTKKKKKKININFIP